MKIYGILGTPYCGSTSLTFIISGAKCVFPIGESIHINNKSKCSVCVDKPCPFWTKEFTEEITQENIHKKVLEKVKQFGDFDIILYADKSPMIYESFKKLGTEFDKFFVLFKSPEAYMYSRLKHDKDNSELMVKELDAYFQVYSYKIFDSKNLFYLSYDDLTTNSVVVIKKLCEWADIPFDEKMLNLRLVGNKIHSISGNTGAYTHIWPKNFVKRFVKSKYWKDNFSKYHSEKALNESGKIIHDIRWKTGLTDKQKEIISAHKPSQDIYKTMLSKRLYI